MKTETTEDLVQGYWLYNDGFAAWGIAMMRNGEEPVKIDKKEYDLSTEERISVYNTKIEQNKKTKAEKLAKEAQKEERKTVPAKKT